MRFMNNFAMVYVGAVVVLVPAMSVRGGTLSLAVEPSSVSLTPGGTSAAINVFLVESGSSLLADIGLSVASIKLELLTPSAVNPHPAVFSDLSPGPDFISGPPDPTPGVLTVFTPDPTFAGILSTTGRIHLASFLVTLPADGGNFTQFAISAADDFQFFSDAAFESISAADVAGTTFDVNRLAAVPAPSAMWGGTALFAAAAVRRRRSARVN